MLLSATCCSAVWLPAMRSFPFPKSIRIFQTPSVRSPILFEEYRFKMARHGAKIILIILGSGVSAFLAAIAAKVAVNDQFSNMLKVQPWYRPWLPWSLFALFAVSTTGFTVWQYLLTHHSKRPSMKLKVGVCDPNRYVDPPEGTKSASETSQLFLLGVPEGAVSVVHCILLLNNTSESAIKGVRVQLEYPEKYLVDDKVVVFFEDSAVVIKKQEPLGQNANREVVVLEGVAQVSYEFDLLRFKESIVIPEPLKVRKIPVTEPLSEFEPAAFKTRLSRKAGFLDYLRLRAFVFSEETRLDTAFDVFFFSGSKTDDVGLTTNAIEEAMWSDCAPKAGEVYFRRKSRVRTSLLEISIPQLKAKFPDRWYEEVWLDPEVLAISTLLLPPGNFRYTNKQQFLGLRLGRVKRQQSTKITYLTPKPPTA